MPIQKSTGPQLLRLLKAFFSRWFRLVNHTWFRDSSKLMRSSGRGVSILLMRFLASLLIVCQWYPLNAKLHCNVLWKMVL